MTQNDAIVPTATLQRIIKADQSRVGASMQMSNCKGKPKEAMGDCAERENVLKRQHSNMQREHRRQS